MIIQYNVTGSERKRMVMAIAECINCKPVYKRVPSCAYEVGRYTISKEGALTYDEFINAEEADKVLSVLARAGFKGKSTGAARQVFKRQNQVAESETSPEEGPLSIAVPKHKVSVDTLTKLLETKGALIQKALGASSTQITVEDEHVEFNWFDRELAPDEVNAYMLFIASLCKLSKELTRVNASPPGQTENEKYAFRCFLLRLGFIGNEYKEARRILLSRLNGSAAFKNGTRGGNGDAISK